MALVSISCVQTVIIITIHNQGASGRRVPRWVRVYILEWARVFKLCRNDNKVNKVTNDDLEDLVDKKPREVSFWAIDRLQLSVNLCCKTSYEPVCEKTKNLGPDQVRLKSGCTVTEDVSSMEFLYSESRGIVLSV